MITEKPMTAKEKFDAALDLAATLCMDCGMHPSEMADALRLKADELASQCETAPVMTSGM